MKHLLIAGVLTLALTGAAAATTIGFDDLNDGDLVTTIDIATFSSSAPAVEVYDFNGDYANSVPNTIGGSGNSWNADIYVDFAQAVNNLSFTLGADNDSTGNIGSVRVFFGAMMSSVLDLTGDGNINTVELQDLSGFSNVTRIEIFNVTDTAGLVYDDFSYDAMPAVPLPAGGLLLLGGLGVLGAMRRRTK